MALPNTSSFRELAMTIADTFCKSVPQLPSVWDPSRLGPAVACLRKHWYVTGRGLRLNGGSSVHQDWGKLYHACTEFFDQQILAGGPREEACLDTLNMAFNATWNPEEDRPVWGQWVDLFQCQDPEWVPRKRGIAHMDVAPKVQNRNRCKYARKAQQDIPLRPMEDVNTLLYAGSCANCGHMVKKVRKWFHEHPKKTRANLLRAVALYCDTPGLSPYVFEDSSPATEVHHSVDLPIISPDGKPYKLVVNIDSVPDYEGFPAIRERKTTGLSSLDWRFWQQFEMNPQSDTYDLVGNIFYADEDRPVKLLLEATRVSQSGETEIQRTPIYIGEERRAEWFAELQEVILDVDMRTQWVMADALAGKETRPEEHFPRRTTACITKNGTCPYWRLCTAEPSDREGIIASDYHIEHWNPLTATSEEENDPG